MLYLCQLFPCQETGRIRPHCNPKKLSAAHQVKLYTNNPTPQLPKVENMGAIDYYEIMPLVFQHSKINLNITLRSIQRAFLCGHSILWEAVVSCWPIIRKISELLCSGRRFHLLFFLWGSRNLCRLLSFPRKERQQIAANALGKILEAHTFEHRIQTMLSVIDGQ